MKAWTIVFAVVLTVVTVTVVSIGLLLYFFSGSAKHDLVTDVPLGSQLSKLDQFIQRGAGSTGEVTQWMPPKGASGEMIETEFGTFAPKKLGDYDYWNAPAKERDRFSGKITFFHHSLTSSDVNEFIYVNGKLRKKDWGFLPG